MCMTFDCIRHGDIYWADLGDPFGSELGYRRPVLVISSEAYIQNSPTIIVAIISTATIIELLPSRIGFTLGKIEREITILFDQLRTIDKSRLIRYMGHACDGDQKFIVALLDALGMGGYN